MKISQEIIEKLIQEATIARDRAYCPYSKFPVGAAAYFEDGQIAHGCNVENASFGGTICAERIAIPSGIASGYGKPIAIAVISKLDEFVKPCGICRQFMYEFGKDLEIYCCTSSGKFEHHILKDLLPDAFGPESLK